MFEKALIATDLSEASFSMIGCSCMKALANLGTEECVLAMHIGRGDLHSVIFGQTLKIFEQWLEEQKKLIEAHGFRTKVAVRAETPAAGIPLLVERERCGFVVLGHQHDGIVQNIFMEGNVFDIIKTASVPVFLFSLTSQEDVPEKVTCCMCIEDILDHILFPTDFSRNAEDAFRVVLELVRKKCRKVTLLHVQEDRRIKPHLENRIEEFNRIDTERLQALRERILQVAQIDVEIRLPRGSAVHEILREADENLASLIVMGNLGRGNLADIFMGSISHNVMSLSKIPLLLVPQKAE